MLSRNCFKSRYLGIGSWSLLLLASCGSIAPEAPAEFVSATKIIPIHSSVISVPIEMDLKSTFAEVNKSVPKTFRGEDAACEGVSVKYYVEREPINFTGKGDGLKYDISAKYSLRINYCPTCTSIFGSEPSCIVPRVYASCGVDEPLREIDLQFKSAFDLASNWKLKSETVVTKINPKTSCELTFIKYDASDKLVEELESILVDVCKDIDKEIGTTDIKSEVNELWNALQDPIDLEGYGFLKMNPENIEVTNLQFDNQKLTFLTKVEIAPDISFSNANSTVKSLPNMRKLKGDEQFDISLDIRANYDSLSNVLTRELKGQRIDVKNKYILIDSVFIASSAGSKINFGMQFSGSKKGVMYFNGTPIFHSATQMLDFPDMTFDIKTKSVLLKTANWLFDKKIEDKIRSACSFDLKQEIKPIVDELNKSINGPLDKNVQMKGRISKVNFSDILPLESAIFMRLQVGGEVSIQVK